MGALWTLAQGLAAMGMAAWAFRRSRRLPTLPVGPVSGPLPALSIIVPARNEAANLQRLLPSLHGLRYPGPLERIVVDDQSEDETSQVAAALGARVLRVEALPEGWFGKPYAAHRGAQAAQGEWLLFTDADTWHAPDSAASAVAWAIAHGTDGLTLFPGFDDLPPIEAAAMAVMFAGLFVAARDLEGLANGQYLLVRRAAYEQVGGFAAVRDQMLEDLALGMRLRQWGFRVPMLHGPDAVRVRMDAGLGAMFNGMARWGSGALAWPRMRSGLAVLWVAVAMRPLLALGARSGYDRLASLMGWGMIAWGMWPWTQRIGRGESALLTPLGAALVAAAGLWGMVRRGVGAGIPWKGRQVR